MSTSLLKRLIPSLENSYDVVIIDTAPTYDNIVLNAVNAFDYVITPINYSQFDFNSSIFLGQKLRMETDHFDKWFLFFSGHESRYDENPESLQNQYRTLFTQNQVFGSKILPVSFPFTRNIRKFADAGEVIRDAGQTAKLHDAVCDLCSIIMGEEIRKVPDAKTIWLFKEKLIEARVSKKLFEKFGKELARNNLIGKEGTIIDAAIVEAPIQHNSKDENEQIKDGKIPEQWQEKQNKAKLSQKDCDARWTKKHKRNYYGYKDHIKIDKKSKLILKATVTAANVKE